MANKPAPEKEVKVSPSGSVMITSGGATTTPSGKTIPKQPPGQTFKPSPEKAAELGLEPGTKIVGTPEGNKVVAPSGQTVVQPKPSTPTIGPALPTFDKKVEVTEPPPVGERPSLLPTPGTVTPPPEPPPAPKKKEPKPVLGPPAPEILLEQAKGKIEVTEAPPPAPTPKKEEPKPVEKKVVLPPEPKKEEKPSLLPVSGTVKPPPEPKGRPGLPLPQEPKAAPPPKGIPTLSPGNTFKPSGPAAERAGLEPGTIVVGTPTGNVSVAPSDYKQIKEIIEGKPSELEERASRLESVINNFKREEDRLNKKWDDKIQNNLFMGNEQEYRQYTTEVATLKARVGQAQQAALLLDKQAKQQIENERIKAETDRMLKAMEKEAFEREYSDIIRIMQRSPTVDEYIEGHQKPGIMQRITDIGKEALSFGAIETASFNRDKLSQQYNQEKKVLESIYDGDTRRLTDLYKSGAYDHVPDKAERYIADIKLTSDIRKDLDSGATFDVSKKEYINSTIGTKPEYVSGILDAMPGLASLSKEVGLAMIPVYGTIRTWKDSGTLGKTLGIASDALWFIPMVGTAAAGARAAQGISRTARATAALQSVVAAEVRAPVQALKHPIKSLKSLGEPVETIVRPSKVPLAGMEITYNTQRIPLLANPKTMMQLRDTVTDLAIAGKKSKSSIDDFSVHISQPMALKDLRPAVLHATEDIRPFLEGTVVKAGREGGLFVAPSLSTRFTEVSAFGDLTPGRIKGALIIRDERILNELAATKKVYKTKAGEVVEIEKKIPAGIDLPKPRQTLMTRDASGDKVVIVVIGKPLSKAEIARFKLVGSMDTLKDIVSSSVQITKKNKKAVSLMDELAIREAELARLRRASKGLSRKAAGAQEVRLVRQIGDLRNRINRSYNGRAEYVLINTRPESILKSRQPKPPKRVADKVIALDNVGRPLVTDTRALANAESTDRPVSIPERGHPAPMLKERRGPIPEPAGRAKGPTGKPELTIPALEVSDRGKPKDADRGKPTIPERGKIEAPQRGKPSLPDRGKVAMPERGKPIYTGKGKGGPSKKGKPPIILPTGEREQPIITVPQGSISWRQGALGQGEDKRPVWITLTPQGDKYYTFAAPKGARIKKGPPKETLFRTSDMIRPVRRTKVGFFDVTVRKGRDIDFDRRPREYLPRGRVRRQRRGTII